MSEQDRMDRAERLRRLREGRRTDSEDRDDEDPTEPTTPPDSGRDVSDSTEDVEPAETDSTGDVESAGTDSTGELVPGEKPTPADQAAPEAGDAGAGSTDASGAELDEAVAAAVERVTGTTAPVPATDDVQAGAESADGTEPTDQDGGPAQAVDPESPGVDSASADSEEAGTPTDATDAPATGHGATAQTRVLEFTLGDEQYCLDIDYVEEIVKDETITRVPNTPKFVAGVVDLRGQITTILNPKVPVGTAETEPGDVLIVFDSEQFDEQGHLGWVVDDVRQVSPIFEGDVDDSPVAGDHIEGVLERDDGQFVVWTSPDLALEEAA